MHTTQNRILLSGVCLLAVSCLSANAQMAVTLASDGTASMPVIVSAGAGEDARAAAAELAGYLGRIGGAEFDVRQGDGSSGIVVGRPQNFEALPFEVRFKGGPLGREEYVLRSAENGLWVLGSTDLAIEDAVWDLLYRLGHRQFFPGEKWEIVPEMEKVSIEVDLREKPDFVTRRIWYNWGLSRYNGKEYHDWCRRNRVRQGFKLRDSHAYESIRNSHREVFEKHPEYLAMIDGERSRGHGHKLCISNPDLRKLVVDARVASVKANPDRECIRMTPSDGGYWCECAECAKLGTPSDRALLLANEVAEAVNDLGLGEKYVGMLAYYQHCAPPNIEVHPNVIISVATGFVTEDLTVDEIMQGWHEKGATLGVYDYFSIVSWDWNMPGSERARAAHPRKLVGFIKRMYDQGARYYNAESGDAWGSCGLGYYLAGRVMWDADEASRADELIEEFLGKAFGPAREPMGEFYRLISEERSETDLELVGDMYRHLAKAWELAADAPDVRARIRDLIIYARYTEFYHYFCNAIDSKRKRHIMRKGLRMLRFAYRMRETMMVHTYGLWCQAGYSKRDFFEEGGSPLKDDRPFSEKEIEGYLKRGAKIGLPEN